MLKTKKQTKLFLVKIVSIILCVVFAFTIVPVSDISDLIISASAEELPEYNPEYGSFTVTEENGNTVLNATSNYGCGFRGWYDKNGNEVSYNTSFKIPAATTAEDYIPVFYSYNLAVNGNFEAYEVGTNMKTEVSADEIWDGMTDSELLGKSDWSSMKISDDRAKSGTKSLKIGCQSNTAYHTFRGLDKNTQYTVKFWYNLDPSVGQTSAGVDFKHYLTHVSVVADGNEITTRANRDGSYLAKQIYSFASGSTEAGEWKEASVTFYTNENTDVTLCILYNSNADTANNISSKPIYIDDLTLVKDVFAAPTYFNENFSVAGHNNWKPYDNNRVGLYQTDDYRFKLSSYWTFKWTQSAPMFLKKGAEYTLSFKLDLSEVEFDQYLPAVTDDNPPQYILDENGNYTWQKSEDGKSYLSNWINFNISNEYRMWGQQGTGTLVTDNDIAGSVKITVADTNGKTMSGYDRNYTAFGFAKKTVTDKGLDPAKLVITMTFTPDETTEAYFNVRLNSPGVYYLDDITIKETQKTVDPTEYLGGTMKSLGTAIRTTGKQGMRYKTSLDKHLLAAEMYYGIRLTEYGTIAIKNEYLGESELTLDGEYSYSGETYTAKKGVAYSFNDNIDLIYSENPDSVDFTGVLMNIAKTNWNSDYTARAYFKYVDKLGNDGVIYLDQSDISVYPISKAAYSAKDANGEYSESPEVREYLYNKIISNFTDKVINIKNASAPAFTNFEGMRSTVYHATTFFPSNHGRTYTDEQAAIEMDRLKDTKVDNVRTRFASQWMWDSSTNKWNWESTKMMAVYKWAEMLQDRDISITLNAGWHLHDFIYFYDKHFNGDTYKYNSTDAGHSTIPEVNYLHGYNDDLTPISDNYGEDSKASAITAMGKEVGLDLTDSEYNYYSVVAARYSEWIKQALNAFKAHGINNVKYVLPFTETGYHRADDPTYSCDEWILMVMALDSELKTEGVRQNYKFVGPSQSNYAYQGRTVQFVEYIYEKIGCTKYEDMIDIISMHQYTTPNTQKGYENTIFDPYACYSRAAENFPYFKQIRENAGVFEKEFWCDEYFAYANDARWHDNIGMQMTQYAAGFTAGMNNGVNRFSVWQMFDCLWDDSATHGTAHLADYKTSNEFIGGIHACGTCPSLVKADGETCTIEGCACKNYTPYSSYVPRTSYYGINLIGKYLNNENASVLNTEVLDDATKDNGGVYVSAIENDLGQTVIMVVNTMPTFSSFDINLEKGNLVGFKRYTYNPDEVVATAEAKSIESDKTINIKGEDSFADILPAGSFAIYVSTGIYNGDDVDMEVPSED